VWELPQGTRRSSVAVVAFAEQTLSEVAPQRRFSDPDLPALDVESPTAAEPSPLSAVTNSSTPSTPSMPPTSMSTGASRENATGPGTLGSLDERKVVKKQCVSEFPRMAEMHWIFADALSSCDTNGPHFTI
jgi:hypothetical protein